MSEIWEWVMTALFWIWYWSLPALPLLVLISTWGQGKHTRREMGEE